LTGKLDTTYNSKNWSISDDAGKSLCQEAMQAWQSETCLKFVERTNQENYAEFRYDPGLVI